MVDVGGTYKFNQRRAKVMRIWRGLVFWADLETKRGIIRQTPLWFFEKYSRELR